jgi:hypothetical protein
MDQVTQRSDPGVVRPVVRGRFLDPRYGGVVQYLGNHGDKGPYYTFIGKAEYPWDEHQSKGYRGHCAVSGTCRADADSTAECAVGECERRDSGELPGR